MGDIEAAGLPNESAASPNRDGCDEGTSLRSSPGYPPFSRLRPSASSSSESVCAGTSAADRGNDHLLPPPPSASAAPTTLLSFLFSSGVPADLTPSLLCRREFLRAAAAAASASVFVDRRNVEPGLSILTSSGSAAAAAAAVAAATAAATSDAGFVREGASATAPTDGRGGTTGAGLSPARGPGVVDNDAFGLVLLLAGVEGAVLPCPLTPSPDRLLLLTALSPA